MDPPGLDNHRDTRTLGHMQPDRSQATPERHASPGLAPRVPARSQKPTTSLYAAGAAFIAVGAGLLFGATVAATDRGAAALAAGGLAALALGAYVVAAIRATCVLLSPDFIEFVELGRRRRWVQPAMRFLGIRVLPASYGFRYYVFEFRQPGRRRITTELLVVWDDELRHWMSTLPNLDAADHDRALETLLERRDLGLTIEERHRTISRARTTARVASVAASAACTWAMVYPRPFAAAMLALAIVPLTTLVVAARRPGLFSVWGERNHPGPAIHLPLFLPSITLAIRAMYVHVVDIKQPVAISLGATALAGFACAGSFQSTCAGPR